MRCPTCDMEIIPAQMVGRHCVYCYQMARDSRLGRSPVQAPRAAKPAPAPAAPVAVAAPKVAAPPPTPEPEESDIPQTVTELRTMLKDDLIDLAEGLELDTEGTKDELVERIAEELGI